MTLLLGGILFVSGLCSLVYQVVWLREFRLLFGGATPAASAVLAVFMGGLGIGGAWLGARVEKSRYPGRFYAWLEAGITLAAVASPALLSIMQSLYLRTGGIQSLGLPLATLVQIGMTAVVIGPSCFLMGGTLPAALKFAQSDGDSRRATTAVFYGINVCGAVAGAFLAGFVLLPTGGNQLTLFSAGFANALIAVLAWVVMRREVGVTDDAVTADGESSRPATPSSEPEGMAMPRWYVYVSAFTSGFVFFLIELVWYRASVPLFGGSVYNFGLILSVALAGIGVGSLLYSMFLRGFRPTLSGFAMVSSLLAFFIILPFVLGDRLAHFSLLLNNFFRPRSFEGLVFGWSVVCGILVFLPAVFSGIQFPLLISLLGRGNRGIGRQIGHTYAWNTLGAVLGALVGGFVLIPQLSVPVCWRLAAIAAVALSIGSLVIAWVKGRTGQRIRVGVPVSAAMSCVVVVAMALLSSGPSSYWFHHPIGYGRAADLFGSSDASWVDYVRGVNRATLKAIDGRETTVSLHSSNEYAFYSNGKSDSAALSDAPTTAMIGITGAALHPSGARDVCVVGLATGVTVGWLTQVDEVRSVDVLELESAAVELSRWFKAVNFGAADHPKTHFIEGDAREFLAVRSKKNYDLIISEPSNLHRAGVANLYTREFYQSVASRMHPDAIFCQWVQAYETDLESIHLVVATLRSVFPKIELWQTLGGDLLLVCSLADQPWNYDRVSERLAKEPFRDACLSIWGTATPEGFFARAIGNKDYVNRMVAEVGQVNTDDHNLLEFAFGRRLGSRNSVIDVLRRGADSHREILPGLQVGSKPFDWETWAEESIWKSVILGDSALLPSPPAGREWSQSLKTQYDFLKRRTSMPDAEKLAAWPEGADTEAATVERVNLLARTGDPAFVQAVEKIRERWPVEAVVLEGLYAAKLQRTRDALDCWFSAIALSQTKPQVRMSVFKDALRRPVELLRDPSPDLLARFPHWFEIAATPLSFAGMTEEQRVLMTSLARHMPVEFKVRAAEAWGPHAPWREDILRFRADAYQQAGHPHAAHARSELDRFLRQNGSAREPGPPKQVP